MPPFLWPHSYTNTFFLTPTPHSLWPQGEVEARIVEMSRECELSEDQEIQLVQTIRGRRTEIATTEIATTDDSGRPAANANKSSDPSSPPPSLPYHLIWKYADHGIRHSRTFSYILVLFPLLYRQMTIPFLCHERSANLLHVLLHSTRSHWSCHTLWPLLFARWTMYRPQ